MFNIFRKSKPKLSEIIPNGFIDIHSHVLPGVDDGAKNLDESESLIFQMNDMGFSKIIGTPHTYPGLYENTNETIKQSYSSLKKLKTNVILDYASEYMLDHSLISKAKQKSLLTIKNNYILVEMSFISAPINLFEILFELQMEGYSPIMAHPERYRFIGGDIDFYKKLKIKGCKFQINLLSTTNHYGRDIMKISNRLINEDLIDFVGSDIHNQQHIDSFKSDHRRYKIGIDKIDKLQKLMENNKVFS